MKEEYEILLIKTKKLDCDQASINLVALYEFLFGVYENFFQVFLLIKKDIGFIAYNDAKDGLKNLLEVLKEKVGNDIIYDIDKKEFRWKND